MARYVVRFDCTEQGVRHAKDTVERVGAARASWERRGIRIEALYWALADHDIVGVVDAPDDATLGAALLQLAGVGNVRTKTLRAFDEGEMRALIGQLG